MPCNSLSVCSKFIDEAKPCHVNLEITQSNSELLLVKMFSWSYGGQLTCFIRSNNPALKRDLSV